MFLSGVGDYREGLYKVGSKGLLLLYRTFCKAIEYLHGASDDWSERMDLMMMFNSAWKQIFSIPFMVWAL